MEREITQAIGQLYTILAAVISFTVTVAYIFSNYTRVRINTFFDDTFDFDTGGFENKKIAFIHHQVIWLGMCLIFILLFIAAGITLLTLHALNGNVVAIIVTTMVVLFLVAYSQVKRINRRVEEGIIAMEELKKTEL